MKEYEIKCTRPNVKTLLEVQKVIPPWEVPPRGFFVHRNRNLGSCHRNLGSRCVQCAGHPSLLRDLEFARQARWELQIDRRGEDEG